MVCTVHAHGDHSLFAPPPASVSRLNKREQRLCGTGDYNGIYSRLAYELRQKGERGDSNIVSQSNLQQPGYTPHIAKGLKDSKILCFDASLAKFEREYSVWIQWTVGIIWSRFSSERRKQKTLTG